MIIDGKALAEENMKRLQLERTTLPERLPLGVVMAKGDAAVDSFVRIKERVAGRLNVTLVREELGEGAATADAVAAVGRLASRCYGIIVQLPLPPAIDVERALASVPPFRDVDAINPLVPDEARLVQAPVAEAVAKIFEYANVRPHGKKAAVIGQGRLVGKPVAHLLKKLGAHVSVITEGSGSLSELSEADIIVSGAGKPGIIMPAFIKNGVVLIDAGTSEADGKIAGDANPSCADKASVFTPVPGGVGPVAVTMIFENLFTLAEGAARQPGLTH